VPVIEKRIAPRERLSADDVAFLRHEIGAEISPPIHRGNAPTSSVPGSLVVLASPFPV
jgi:hypothetical protein